MVCSRKDYRMNNHEVLIVLNVVLISIIAGLLILLDHHRPSYYEWLPVLPISFGLVNLMTYRIYFDIRHNLPYILVIGLYGVRDVITPLAMRYGEYAGKMHLLNARNGSWAVAMIVYETLLVFLVLLVLCHRERNGSQSTIGAVRVLKAKPSKLLVPIMGVMVIICATAYIKVPKLAANKITILELDHLSELVSTAKLVKPGTYERVLCTLFNFIFGSLRMLLGTTFIWMIRRKIGDNWIGVMVALIVIISQLFFITNETGYVFIVVFTLFVTTHFLFIKMRKKLMYIFILGFIGMTGIVIMAKSAILSGVEEDNGRSVSIMLQAYFPGTCNIASIFNLDDHSKLQTLQSDICSTIPFRTTLLPSVKSDGIYEIYAKQNRQWYQIVPCIGQAYHYLGFVFAPTIPILLILCGVQYGRKLENAKDIWAYNADLLISIFSCVTPIMYNATIWGTRFFNTMLPLLIISKYLAIKVWSKKDIDLRFDKYPLPLKRVEEKI